MPGHPRKHPGAAGDLACILMCLLLCVSCDTAAEPTGEHIIEGVDLSALFAAPTPAEVQATLGEWAGRDLSVQDYALVDTASLSLGGDLFGLRIVSHRVGGVRHYGALLVPAGARPDRLPVLVYAHGGDGGVKIDEVALILLGLGDVRDQFVYVVPSFRAEPLIFGGEHYLSEGPPSPWDRDVDDALALLNTALATIPDADALRIGVLGFSRGGGVGLLMAARDPRIDLVVEFFGPTDFFDVFVQDVVREALRGQPRDLPGLSYLNTTFIQPLKRGTRSIEEVRPELIRRSAVLFADRLPQIQVHHGTADRIVPVSQAQAMGAAMARLGRAEPAFEFFLYEGGHHPFELPGSISRSIAFLSRLLTPPGTADRPRAKRNGGVEEETRHR